MEVLEAAEDGDAPNPANTGLVHPGSAWTAPERVA
jgi:hypothetical protein